VSKLNGGWARHSPAVWRDVVDGILGCTRHSSVLGSWGNTECLPLLHIIVVPVGNWDTLVGANNEPWFLVHGNWTGWVSLEQILFVGELCGETEVSFLDLFDTNLKWTPTWVQHTCRCYLLDILCVSSHCYPMCYYIIDWYQYQSHSFICVRKYMDARSKWFSHITSNFKLLSLKSCYIASSTEIWGADSCEGRREMDYSKPCNHWC
jgi:hypothetical protein